MRTKGGSKANEGRIELKLRVQSEYVRVSQEKYLTLLIEADLSENEEFVT